MSNTRYIEIDSNYRNRNEWPLPSDFEILISQSGRKGKNDAVDPVSDSAPIYAWTSNRMDPTSTTLTITGVVDSISLQNNIAGTTSTKNIILTSSTDRFQHETDYYINLMLLDTTINVRRRITSYKYLGTDNIGNDRAMVSVLPAFPDTFIPGNDWEISDPTDISNTSFPLFYIPAGKNGINSYYNYILYNETQNDYRIINSYNNSTHIATVNTSTSPVTGWATGDNYCIRKQLPLAITGVNAVASTTSSIVLLSGPSVDNIYNNNFIRIRASIYGNGINNPETEVRRILSYDSTTLTVTVYPPFSQPLVVGNQVEILDFSYDNMNPFVYTGSMVSQQEMVCYEIELINIILPNKILSSGFGSRIAFYPYIYVEISNVSGSSAGMKNTIYSNNPNSTRMIFRVPIDDVQNPIVSSFIKVDGDGMVQTLKFKPNDNLRFSVHLSNGELYTTIEDEYYSPYAPNPEIQISAMFAIKRI